MANLLALAKDAARTVRERPAVAIGAGVAILLAARLVGSREESAEEVPAGPAPLDLGNVGGGPFGSPIPDVSYGNPIITDPGPGPIIPIPPPPIIIPPTPPAPIPELPPQAPGPPPPAPTPPPPTIVPNLRSKCSSVSIRTGPGTNYPKRYSVGSGRRARMVAGVGGGAYTAPGSCGANGSFWYRIDWLDGVGSLNPPLYTASTFWTRI